MGMTGRARRDQTAGFSRGRFDLRLTFLLRCLGGSATAWGMVAFSLFLMIGVSLFCFSTVIAFVILGWKSNFVSRVFLRAAAILQCKVERVPRQRQGRSSHPVAMLSARSSLASERGKGGSCRFEEAERGEAA